MSSIVIVDTSVLLNIMDVPSRNQHKQDVLNRLGVLIEAGDCVTTSSFRWPPSSRLATTSPK